MTSYHGKFVWYELMTSDAKSAETFYKKVVGWGARDSGQKDKHYTLLSVGETPVAGLMPLPKEAVGAKPGWVGYIAVDDVDAYAAKVKQAGGSVHRAPDDIPTVGRFAMVSDPQGAMFVLFKPSDAMQSPPEPAQGTPGTPGWRELAAADWRPAFDFYSKLFGWEKGDAVDMGPMGTYQLFTAGNGPIGGMMSKPPTIPKPFWMYYFNTDSVDAAKGRVEAAGGKIANGPHEVPGGSWIVQCIDPQGALFSLVGPKG